VIVLEPEIKVTSIDGRTESMYVVFRQGVHARETLPFSRPDGAELFIDVDENDFPIAMQIVESFDPPPPDGARPSDDLPVVLELYTFANQMIAYHRANQQARGNALIKDALESARGLAPGAVSMMP
jgi:hypothetical protein